MMIKALIADDNWKYSKNVINTIVNRINKLKIEYVAEDGEETLEAISKNYFDLVLLDLQMPKMTGLEVIEEIEKLNMIKHPKIIIISGDLPLVKCASISKIVCSIILKTESIESIYEKILRIVNQIIYDKNYDMLRNKTISALKNMGYGLKHKGTRYIIEAIMYIFENNSLNIMNNLEKNVYVHIAHKYCTSLNNVKTNIVKATKLATKNDYNLLPKDVIIEIVSRYVA